MSGETAIRWTEPLRPGYWRGRVQEMIAYTPDGTSMPAEMWRNRHRTIVLSALAHVPFLLALGVFAGTEPVTGARIPATPLPLLLGETAVVTLVALAGASSRIGRRTRTVLASLALMSTSTLLVQFSGGYIEAHFHFFVAMAVLALYEDWLPFAVGFAYVGIGHGVFSMIDASRVYNHPAALGNPWAWAGVHAAFIGALTVALMTNWYSIERSREEAADQLAEVERQRAEIEDIENAKATVEAKQTEVAELNEELETTADRFSATFETAAAGDLTVRLDTDTDSEAMTQIAADFNEMMDELERVVRDVQSFATEVTQATRQTTSRLTTARSDSVDVQRSIETIATGADEQRSKLEQVSGEMNDLSATIEEVASSAQGVAERAEQNAEVAQNGKTTAQEAMGHVESVQAAIETTVTNVRALDEQMDEIEEIVGLIGDIAEQTNMLALNANIEAARASGEGGDTDGFAVVADEVKTLATETQAAATDIETLIAETKAQTETTVSEVTAADASVTETAEAVEAVTDAFVQVADNASETSDGVGEISRATDDQAASTEEAVSMVEEVTEIGTTTATEAREVAATTDEQVASLERVTDDAESITDRATELNELLAQFDTAEPDTTDTATANSNTEPTGHDSDPSSDETETAGHDADAAPSDAETTGDDADPNPGDAEAARHDADHSPGNAEATRHDADPNLDDSEATRHESDAALGDGGVRNQT